MEWSREKVKEVLEALRLCPDFEEFPFPDDWAKEFDIPITPAKIVDLNTYLKKNKEVRLVLIDKYEVKESDGIVRTIPEPKEEPLTLTIKTIAVTPETEFGISEQLLENQELPKESNETETQDCQDSSTELPQLLHDVQDTSPSSPCPC